jgi:hypothetical protein
VQPDAAGVGDLADVVGGAPDDGQQVVGLRAPMMAQTPATAYSTP